MNYIDLCLEIVSRACQPLRYIRRWIPRKPLEIEALFQRITNRKWPMGCQMVTWPMTSRGPERCCDAVRSAILATAWLLVVSLLSCPFSVVPYFWGLECVCMPKRTLHNTQRPISNILSRRMTACYFCCRWWIWCWWLQVTGVMTQGRSDGKEWVTSYVVSYSLDAYVWKYATDFNGNRKVSIRMTPLADGWNDIFSPRWTEENTKLI